MDSRSRTEIWLEAAQRLVMINTMSRWLPLYIVTEYPKSGGTWISQILSDCIGVPFPRNRRPHFESSIMHGHMLHTPTMKNVIVVNRDGRDCMVSWYFHTLFQNDKNSPHLVNKTRRDLAFNDFEDVNRNLPTFIEYIFDKDMHSKSPYKFTWVQFVRSWIEIDCARLTYEAMVEDGALEISRVLQQLKLNDISLLHIENVVEKYSFSRQTKREPGVELRTSFLRKGQPGDWRNKFSRSAAQVFDHYAGEELILLGYENNRNWIEETQE